MKKLAYLLGTALSALAAVVSSVAGGSQATSTPEQNTGATKIVDPIKISQAAKVQIAQAAQSGATNPPRTIKTPGTEGPRKPTGEGGWIDTFKDKGKFYETQFNDKKKPQVTSPAGSPRKQFQRNQPGR